MNDTIENHLRGATLVEGSIAAVVQSMASALGKFGETTVREYPALQTAMRATMPLKSFGYKYLAVPLSDWVIVISDMVGELAEPLHLFSGMNCVSLWAAEEHRMLRFTTPASERWIICYKELASWKFAQRGSPLGFEELSAYARRSPSARLTVSMVREYAMRLTGITFPAPLPLAAPATVCVRSIDRVEVRIEEYPAPIPAAIIIG